MKLNNEKAIKKEIAKLGKEIKLSDAGGSRGGLQHYREGYRDALVRVLTDTPKRRVRHSMRGDSRTGWVRNSN